MSRRHASICFVLCAAVFGAGSAVADDDRLVLSAPNMLGHNGLVRTTSAIIDDTGTVQLGLQGRIFASPNFVVSDAEDAATFMEGNAALGFSLFHMLEFAVQSRAGVVLNAARSQPQASVGDLGLGLKGGYDFGLVAVAANARFGLPTRANRVGFDINNANAGGGAAVSFNLLELGLPLRAHLNGGYTFELGKTTEEDPNKNRFFLDGEDGALLAMATQQWFFDHAHVGVGLEAPFPYVTPFVELWYETAIGAEDYAAFGDAWLTVTPGARFGIGGLRIDAAIDIGLSGTGGGVEVDIDNVVNGQPINPAYAVRVGVAHTFDIFGGSGGGGGDGGFGRVEGCAKSGGAVVAGAVASVSVDGQAGPRVLADDKGCFSLPVRKGAVSVVVSAPGFNEVKVDGVADAGAVVRADAELVGAPAMAKLKGFITNKDDEGLDATVTLNDGNSKSVNVDGGVFDADVAAGRVMVVARAKGYLSQGVRAFIDKDTLSTVSLVMRKEPKKRSLTLGAQGIDIAGRVPFVFKSERLQSTAGYLLDEIVDLMLENPALRLSIEVHTDPSEADDASVAKALTEGRAVVVKDALVDLGIEPDRLETAGYGITNLVGPPNDPKNRRVELLIIK
jgi:outer membrane protein OmpA-like peptidoglycan-associated protein